MVVHKRHKVPFLFNLTHTNCNMEDSGGTHGKHRDILVEYIMEI